MRILEIKLVPSRDGAQERFTISIHRKRNDEYISYSSYDVMAGDKDAERRIMIEDTDRLVIEAQADHTLVYDRDQMVATPAPIDDSAKEKKEEFNKKQEELHEKNLEIDEKKAKEGDIGTPFRTTLGNVPEDPSGAAKAKAAAEARAEASKPKEAGTKAQGERQRTPIDSDQVKK